MAREFNGSSTDINWGDTTILDGLTAMSFFCLLWFDDFDIPDGAISIIRKDGTWTSVQMYDSTTWGGAGWDNGGVAHEFSGSVSISTGAWHSFLYRWGASANSGNPELSIDGGSYATLSGGEGGITDSVYASGTNPLMFGASESSTEYFDGRMAEVAIWNTALADGAEAVLADGFSSLFVQPTSLIFYSPLIGRFSPEIDIVGGLSGTVTSATAVAHPRIIYPQGAF